MVTCLWCHEEIPFERKRSARYCSVICNYEAKKDRSNERYHRSVELFKVQIKNEAILELFYPLMEMKESITSAMLQAKGFNWGFAAGLDTDGIDHTWKRVGKHSYRVKNNIVEIWKRSY